LLDASNKFEDIFRMPDLLTLSAMKALALGGRGKIIYINILFKKTITLFNKFLIKQKKYLQIPSIQFYSKNKFALLQI
jgi:hypothetical protein